MNTKIICNLAQSTIARYIGFYQSGSTTSRGNIHAAGIQVSTQRAQAVEVGGQSVDVSVTLGGL